MLHFDKYQAPGSYGQNVTITCEGTTMDLLAPLPFTRNLSVDPAGTVEIGSVTGSVTDGIGPGDDGGGVANWLIAIIGTAALLFGAFFVPALRAPASSHDKIQ